MKIAIIMLGADGSVLRTMPLAKALKKKYPDSEINWITKGDVSTLLQNVPYIDKVYAIPYIVEEKFDVLYNFDTEEEAGLLALSIPADKKYGFYSEGGFPMAFTPAGEYYINTMFDDELKKKNSKTYQEMMFEVAELPYEKERSEIFLTDEDLGYADEFAKINKLGSEKLIGIHMGASSRWPSKVWSEKKVREFIIRADKEEYKIILFGGPNEIGKHEELAKELDKYGVKIYRNNPKNSKREFASLVSLCDVMVCSDSFSLHVSIALGKPTIGLFFCTSDKEIEGYGLLKKIVSPLLYDFFPEKSDQYSEKLVNSISAEEVLTALKEIKISNK